MHVRTVDDRSAAALAEWLRQHDCAVYRLALDELDVSPLGSINADLAAPELALLLQTWLQEHPGEAVRLDLGDASGRRREQDVADPETLGAC